MNRRTSRLWHPFADMSKVATNELVIDRGEGAWVFGAAGKRYLDAAAALWYCNVGHGRTELAEVAAKQMKKLAGFQLFDVMANAPALALAERVCDLAPLGDGSAAFFTNGGSDAIDTAGKMARKFWAASGKPERRIIVTRESAYHGMNAFGTSLAGIEANTVGWGPLVTDVIVVPRDDVEALRRVLEENAGKVAAFIGEPVQGAGGVYPPKPGYWPAVDALCRTHDVLLIVDEVITGFGRVGRWFGSERYGMTPDLLVGAKGITSGYLPLGVVVASGRVCDVLWSAQAGMFRHGYTYSGHPAACAVALANLDIIEREQLIPRVARLEETLESELGALRSHPLVAEVRVGGLLCGVELTEEARRADPTLVERVVVGARERGVIVRNLVARALQISPPFVIEPAEIRLLATTLRETLDDVRARLPGPTGAAARN